MWGKWGVDHSLGNSCPFGGMRQHVKFQKICVIREGCTCVGNPRLRALIHRSSMLLSEDNRGYPDLTPPTPLSCQLSFMPHQKRVLEGLLFHLRFFPVFILFLRWPDDGTTSNSWTTACAKRATCHYIPLNPPLHPNDKYTKYIIHEHT